MANLYLTEQNSILRKTGDRPFELEIRNLARITVKYGETRKTQKSSKSACKPQRINMLAEIEKEVKKGVGYRKIISVCML